MCFDCLTLTTLRAQGVNSGHGVYERCSPLYAFDHRSVTSGSLINLVIHSLTNTLLLNTDLKFWLTWGGGGSFLGCGVKACQLPESQPLDRLGSVFVCNVTANNVTESPKAKNFKHIR